MSGEDRYVRVNGLNLHYVEHGRHGRPGLPEIVCFHGAGAHGHVWDSFAAMVSEKLRVLALTFRGHGDSDRASNYDWGSFNLDSASFIQELSLVPAVVCGHSLGGGTAIAVAALWPMLVKRLIIVDASIRPDREGWNRITSSMTQRPESFKTSVEAVDWFRDHIPGLPDDELQRYIEADLICGDDRRFRRKTDPALAAAGLSMSQEDAAHAARQGEEFLTNALKMIACPALLVRGSRSDILDHGTAEEMVGLLKDGRLVEIDAGHSVFQERPREFADAVVSFVGD